MPTRLDPRIGGEMVFDAGGFQSAGVVTQYTLHERFAYEEPWPVADHILERYPQLADLDPGSITPIATEFLVESVSGGSCVIRVVTSAFGSGADWEKEYFAEMMDDVALILEKLPRAPHRAGVKEATKPRGTEAGSYRSIPGAPAPEAPSSSSMMTGTRTGTERGR